MQPIKSFVLSALLCVVSTGAQAAPLQATIMEIQGSGQFSPLAGQQVTTEGIVTQTTANGRHFWLQDAAGDGHGETSDGIFVSGGVQIASLGLRPGDRIRLSAEVQEQVFGRALPLTRLRRIAEIEIIDRDMPQPAAVEIHRLPDESIPDAIAFWERLEGMRVRVDKALVVAPTSRFGETVVITRANARRDSGYEPRTGVIRLRSEGEGEVDYNPERILLDDSTLTMPEVMPGQRMTNLRGVVDYTFGNYKIQLDRFELAEGPRPRKGQREKSKRWSPLTLASFNLENLFDLIDDPDTDDGSSTPSAEALQIKLDKLSLAIIDTLRLPTVIAVQEVENETILRTLAERINARSGSQYAVRALGSSDGRGIENGLMWDRRHISLRSAQRLGGDAIEAAFGAGSASPGREPLHGIFEHGGRPLHVIVNHFKSKGGDDPLFGQRQPPLRITEEQRKLQALALRQHIDRILDEDGHSELVVTGDFNDFEFAEPGEGEDHPLAIIAGLDEDQPRLHNLIEEIPASGRYSYIFDGNAQVLDHMLVSEAVAEALKEVAFVHINAGSPAALAGDATTARRSSDHDPLLASFRFRQHDH